MEKNNNSGRGLFQISKPFFGIVNSKIETLEVQEELESIDEDEVIEEREGVHYISGKVLDTGLEKGITLNREFKNLVDSVIK